MALALAQAGAPGWRVDVATHGGLAGRGAGGVSIRSSGEARIVAAEGHACELRLERRELAALDRAVRRARPGRWRSRYYLPDNPTGCCDQVATTLALVRGGRREQRSVTGWYDESRQTVPPDALSLHDLALELAMAHQGCAFTRSPR